MAIWQIMFTGSGTLVAQKRDTGRRQAIFFSLDPDSGKLLTDGFQPLLSDEAGPAGEGWFTGLESTSEHLAYCHSYMQNSPEHLGIWAYDPGEGRVAWTRPDVVFSANLGTDLLVYRPTVFAGFPERFFMLLDALTGRTVRELGEDNPETASLRMNAVPEEDRQQVRLPLMTSAAGLPHELVAISLPETALLEYIPSGKSGALAVHEPHGHSGTWVSSIKVCRNGFLYEDTMLRDTEAPALNNFLIRGDKLYYIKGKEELVSVALP